MKKISEKEKQRILELHHKTPMKPYLFEQQYQEDLGLGYGVNPQKWDNEKLKTLTKGQVPFKNIEEGNKFRKWFNQNYPILAINLGLSSSGPYNNENIQWAWYYPTRDVYNIIGNKYSAPIFEKNTPSEVVTFYNRLQPLLEKAKEWWRNWLSKEETIIKFKKLNNIMGDFEAVEWFVKYLNLIDEIYVVVYNQTNENPVKVINYTNPNGNTSDGCINAVACVRSYQNALNKINFNILYSYKSDEYIISSLIHEMQHLLYMIKPLTPTKNITKFRSSDDCYNINRTIYNQTSIEDRDKKVLGDLNIDTKKLNSIATDLGFDINRTKYIVDECLWLAYEGWDADYFQMDDSELLSRISEIRHLIFKNTNRTDITKDDFLKLLKFKNFSEIDGEIQYILGYWASKGFPPLESFANELNTSFVKADQKNIKNSSTDLPYKSKEGMA